VGLQLHPINGWSPRDERISQQTFVATPEAQRSTAKHSEAQRSTAKHMASLELLEGTRARDLQQLLWLRGAS